VHGYFHAIYYFVFCVKEKNVNMMYIFSKQLFYGKIMFTFNFK